MRQKVTQEKVRMAIAQLKESGEKPTIDKIRRITGGGNPLIMRFKNEIENDISVIESKNESKTDNAQSGDAYEKMDLTQKERISLLETQLHEIKQLLKMSAEDRIKLLEQELEKYKAGYVRQKQIVKIQGDVIRRLRERLRMITPQDDEENSKIIH
jgi:hypothetical protein